MATTETRRSCGRQGRREELLDAADRVVRRRRRETSRWLETREVPREQVAMYLAAIVLDGASALPRSARTA